MAKRPQPLLNRAAIASTVGVVLYLILRLVGVEVASETVEQVADAVAGLVVAGGPLVAAFWARGQVTPVADPRSEFNETLVVEPYEADVHGHDALEGEVVLARKATVSPRMVTRRRL